MQKSVFRVFLLLCGEAADSALNYFCAKPSPSSVSGCVAGRVARASPFAIVLESSRGALVAQGLGMRVDTLLHRLAVERFGWGCGVGTAVGSYAPS